ncbi:MAG: hypothetical protein K1X64_11085 [Myxococcaceae bacterium]|nr:hypothetical protein [Myxococcaceae bacterium]
MKSKALLFPTREALTVALRSHVIPPELQREPVDFADIEQGVAVWPLGALPGERRSALKELGVGEKDVSATRRRADCWAAVLPPVPTDLPAGRLPQALLAVRTPEAMLKVCGELLRLGCERQSFQRIGAEALFALVKVEEPSWYVLGQALENSGGFTAYLPSPAGQQTVWTQLGYRHPFETSLQAPSSGFVLIDGDGHWRAYDKGEWEDVGQWVEPSLPHAVTRLSSVDLPRLRVPMQLRRALRPDAPSLWVNEAGVETVERWVANAPETVLDDVLFAVSGTTVVLAARPGRERAVGELPGTAYARLLELPNLYAPYGMTLEPPLRRDRVRAWLAPDSDTVYWLTEKLAPTALPLNAFRPLSEWVDYVIDTAHTALQPWVKSAAFEFGVFEAHADEVFSAVTGAVAPEGKPAAPSFESKPALTVGKSRSAKSRSLKDAAKEVPPPARSAPTVRLTQASGAGPSETEQALDAEEAAFKKSDAAWDAPERLQAWAKLAPLYASTQQWREAGLAWVHALWESPGDAAAVLAAQWAQTAPMPLGELLKLTAPTQDQSRWVVSQLLAACAGKQGLASNVNLAQVSAWLEQHDANLDVRSFWLARWALAQLSQGDALGLARARDRMLARLQRGLSLERDVPRFLRLTGTTLQGREGERAQRVNAQLEGLLKAFEDTPRKRSAIEAPLPLTMAYVGLEFAWGFARLGRVDRAATLREKALKALDTHDGVHHFLSSAYRQRIAQALEGLSPETPLPAELLATLTTLPTFARYTVDRLRQSSSVLEPQERLNATEDLGRRYGSEKGEEPAALRSITDTMELVRALEKRAQAAADPKYAPEERARLLDTLMDFLPRVPESSALPLLNQFVATSANLPARLRIVVLEDGLKVAGHFGRSSLVKQLLLTLMGLISELGAEGVAELGSALAAGVRSLRRVGLKDEAVELLGRAQKVLKANDLATAMTRLSLASGFAYLGQLDRALPVFEDAQARLAQERDLHVIDRLKLARSAARAFGNAPTEVALPLLGRLAGQLPFLTDSLNTNKYFCLSLVDFADTLVLGHVGDDLTLNEATRHFLEEDEYRVRYRVHRDAGG